MGGNHCRHNIAVTAINSEKAADTSVDFMCTAATAAMPCLRHCWTAAVSRALSGGASARCPASVRCWSQICRSRYNNHCPFICAHSLTQPAFLPPSGVDMCSNLGTWHLGTWHLDPSIAQMSLHREPTGYPKREADLPVPQCSCTEEVISASRIIHSHHCRVTDLKWRHQTH